MTIDIDGTPSQEDLIVSGLRLLTSGELVLAEFRRQEAWVLGGLRSKGKPDAADGLFGKMVSDELAKGQTPRLEPGAWDHEHCCVCCDAIGQLAEAKGDLGYTDGTNWLCTTCHELFVKPGAPHRSLWDRAVEAGPFGETGP